MPCSKSINIGQPILECELCHIAIHTKCYKSAAFSFCNNLWACRTCSTDITPRYNPFEKMIGKVDSDKFYENDQAGEDQTLQAISNVLNQCQSYTTKELNQAIKQFQPSSPGSLTRTTQFSSYLAIGSAEDLPPRFRPNPRGNARTPRVSARIRANPRRKFFRRASSLILY